MWPPWFTDWLLLLGPAWLPQCCRKSPHPCSLGPTLPLSLLPSPSSLSPFILILTQKRLGSQGFSTWLFLTLPTPLGGLCELWRLSSSLLNLSSSNHCFLMNSRVKLPFQEESPGASACSCRTRLHLPAGSSLRSALHSAPSRLGTEGRAPSAGAPLEGGAWGTGRTVGASLGLRER